MSQFTPSTYIVELFIVILRMSKGWTGTMIHKWYERIHLVTDLRERIYYGRTGTNRYYFVNEYLNSEANIGNLLPKIDNCRNSVEKPADRLMESDLCVSSWSCSGTIMISSRGPSTCQPPMIVLIWIHVYTTDYLWLYCFIQHAKSSFIHTSIFTLILGRLIFAI